MNTTWIKRTEWEPSASDFPIVGGAYILGGDKQWDEGCYQAPGFIPPWFTHWRSIKADPPPRELTQRERDDVAAIAASNEAYRLDEEKGEAYSVGSARRAIYAERREVAKLLDANLAHWRTANVGWCVLMRARLDEQGQGK